MMCLIFSYVSEFYNISRWKTFLQFILDLTKYIRERFTRDFFGHYVIYQLSYVFKTESITSIHFVENDQKLSTINKTTEIRIRYYEQNYFQIELLLISIKDSDHAVKLEVPQVTSRVDLNQRICIFYVIIWKTKLLEQLHWFILLDSTITRGVSMLKQIICTLTLLFLFIIVSIRDELLEFVKWFSRWLCLNRRFGQVRRQNTSVIYHLVICIIVYRIRYVLIKDFKWKIDYLYHWIYDKWRACHDLELEMQWLRSIYLYYRSWRPGNYTHIVGLALIGKHNDIWDLIVERAQKQRFRMNRRLIWSMIRNISCRAWKYKGLILSWTFIIFNYHCFIMLIAKWVRAVTQLETIQI